MRVLKFNLSGETAFFKKPDVNSNTYFTYGQIHRIAVLGLLGSCLGLKGYNQQKKDEIYPQFYEKLKNLKIGIIPKSSENGTIRKKVQTFNNSTMFANKGKDTFGANLIVNEQWLEKPEWDILVLLEDNDICTQLENNFKKRIFKYVPYLGKNDHFANITNIEIIEGVKNVSGPKRVNSLFRRDEFEFVSGQEDSCLNTYDDKEVYFKYQEKLPVELEGSTNQYIVDTLIYSNMVVSPISNESLYEVKNKIICFL